MHCLKFFRCLENIPQAWAPGCIRSLLKTGVESNCQRTEHCCHVQVRSLRHATFSWLRSIVLKPSVDSNCQRAERCPPVQVRSLRHAIFSKGGSCGPAKLVGIWIEAHCDYFVWLPIPACWWRCTPGFVGPQCGLCASWSYTSKVSERWEIAWGDINRIMWRQENKVSSQTSRKWARGLWRLPKQQVFAVKLVSLLLLSLKCIGAVVLIWL